jgi:hypothetical protein
VERIIHFEVEGRKAIGFDSGLSDQAFAQAKLAQFINLPGYILEPDGSYRVWKALGVAEHQGTMVIWGPDFPGERLDRIIVGGIGDDAGQALDALRRWIGARLALAQILGRAAEQAATQEAELPKPWPAGALAAVNGTPSIFFPPERLVRRALEAEGDEAWLQGAESWVHPDLSGEAGDAFTAAALAYRIFCGVPPFSNRNADLVREDIREGVFSPIRLAAPGLDEALSGLIDGAMASTAQAARSSKGGLSGKAAAAAQRAFAGKAPAVGKSSLEALGQRLGAPGSARAAAYFRPLNDAERKKIEAEKEQFRKKAAIAIKSKRFLRRNAAILGTAAAVLVIAALIVFSTMRSRAALPTTEGMSPPEVIAAYYGAFASLDHTLMSACVLKKAGSEDISLVTNVFLVNRTRQAYEMTNPTLSAQDWLDAGSPPAFVAVFGVTGLEITGLDEEAGDGEVRYRADYTLWMPESYLPDWERPEDPGNPLDNPEMIAEPPPVLPVGQDIRDEVRLVWHKDAWHEDAWRIAEISREGR